MSLRELNSYVRGLPAESRTMRALAAEYEREQQGRREQARPKSPAQMNPAQVRAFFGR